MRFENVFYPDQELEKIDEDDEIYEKIEAPKYVDLTRADQFYPDDRNWFCLRIGCDQNHEDVDPDALHKNFVLRVMAARSPNLRLRKALKSREVPSAYMKCPLSAPAKPSKPRICRFTALASGSQKMVAVKVKAVPAPTVNWTPSEEKKEPTSVAKALTTPRVKKCIPSSDHFRSVQNPKRSDAVATGKVVAKVLVFNTPKKTERRISLSESETPLTDICDGMKKLEINSQKKKPSQNSRTASDPSTLKQYSKKLKRQVKNYDDCKDQGVKSSKLTKNTRKFVKKSSCPQPQSIPITDAEIDRESKSGSYGVCSVSGTSRSDAGSRNEQQSGYETRRRVALTTQEECLPIKDTSSIVTPLTEICNGLKNLEINSQRRKPLWNSSKFLALSTGRPERSRTISDPSISKKIKNRSSASANIKDKGVKSLKSKKSSSTINSKKFSCPQLPGFGNGDFQTDGGLEKGSLGDCTVSGTSRNNKKQVNSVMTTPGVTPELCLPHLEAFSVGENVQAHQADASCLPHLEACSVGENVQAHQADASCLPHLEAFSVGENVQAHQADASSSYPNGSVLSNSEKVLSDEEGHIEVNNGNNHGGELKSNDLEDLDDSVGVTTNACKEETPSSLDKSLMGENDLIGENVQSVLVGVPSNNQGSCLTISEKHSENEVQMMNIGGDEIGDIDESKGDDVQRLASELKSSNEDKETSALETLNKDGLESEAINNDDKENAASSADNRISNLDEDQAQRNFPQHQTHENQPKVVLDTHGKAFKGNSAMSTTGPLLGKYKKTKPTNPKPFRLRTDERANSEKRHMPAPLQEITLVPRNSDGCIRRKTNERKAKSHGQHRQENVSHESSQVESYKPNHKIQNQKTGTAYHKPPKSVVDPNTSTNFILTQKKLDNDVEREAQKRVLQTPKPPLQLQHMKTPRRIGTKKSTTISLVASRRLSIIKEKSSTIIRPKETKSRNKRTLPGSISYAGISLAREKKAATIPKEPNFHTPRRSTKTALDAFHAPKSCKRTSVEVMAS